MVLECLPMTRETWVQSQIESCQRLKKKKKNLIPPCLTLSIIRYGSRVKWSNPGKGVVPSPTTWCRSYWKRERSSHPRLWSPTLLNWAIGLMSRVFANGPGDWGSISGPVIPKTLKMVLDATLLSTQHYKVRIKGKEEQSRERSSALSYTSM